MVTLRGDVANIKAELGGIPLEIKKIGDVLITQADQNRRILHLEEDFSRASPRPGAAFKGSTGNGRDAIEVRVASRTGSSPIPAVGLGRLVWWRWIPVAATGASSCSGPASHSQPS
jgi:hypothetical protein